MIAFSIHSGWMKDMISMPNVRSASAIARNFARKERVCLSTKKEDYDASRVWKKMAFAKGKVGFFRRKVEFCKNYVKVHKVYSLFLHYETSRMTNI